MTLAEFHERVCEPPLAQVRKKGALPLCCCVLTQISQSILYQSEKDNQSFQSRYITPKIMYKIKRAFTTISDRPSFSLQRAMGF